MKEGLVIFRFKSELEFDSVRFSGESINIKELKKKICNQRKITQCIDKELLVYDYQTQKEISDEVLPTNCQVIVQRKLAGSNEPIVIDYNNREIKNNRTKYQQLNSENKKCNLCLNLTVNQFITGCCTKLACKSCIEKCLVNNQGVCQICHQIPQKVYMSMSLHKEKEKQQQATLKRQQMLQEQQLMELQQQQLAQLQHQQEQQVQSQSQQQQFQQQQQIKELQELNISNIQKIEEYNQQREQERSSTILEKYLFNARYFIIKSNNEENLQIARQHNEWATTVSNQAKLIEAFVQKSNVILLFSVNKSAKFQGFARMESNIQNYQSQYWKDKDMIKLGGVFKIRWLKHSELSFAKVGNYKNPLNNNDPIKKSRDTTELPADMGYEISNMFEGPLFVQDYQDTLKHQADDLVPPQGPTNPQPIPNQSNFLNIQKLGNLYGFGGSSQANKQKLEESLMSSKEVSRKNSEDGIQSNKVIAPQLGQLGGGGLPQMGGGGMGMDQQQQQQNMFQQMMFNQMSQMNQMYPMGMYPQQYNRSQPTANLHQPDKPHDKDSSSPSRHNRKNKKRSRSRDRNDRSRDRNDKHKRRPKRKH